MRISKTLRSKILALSSEGMQSYQIAELLDVSECLVARVLHPGE